MSKTANTEQDNLVIDIKGLTRSFQGKVAVDNLDLQIPEGQIYGFLGPNGAGKSTTIKMLVTLLTYDSGEGNILGYDLKNDTDKIRLQIGVALQEASLDESQTGIEFLRMQASLYGLSKTQTDHRIQDLISLIDIGKALKKPIKTYSGGMKRRLDLAAAIIHNPKILFLDEPTTGLDPISRSKVWQEIQRLNKEIGMTIFLTTQYLEEADYLADRVGIIAGGKLLIEGTPENLKKSVGDDLIIIKVADLDNSVGSQIQAIEGVNSVDIKAKELQISSKDGSQVVGQITNVLSKANLSIEKLVMRTTTLDDVFLEVTGNRFSQKDLLK